MNIKPITAQATPIRNNNKNNPQFERLFHKRNIKLSPNPVVKTLQTRREMIGGLLSGLFVLGLGAKGIQGCVRNQELAKKAQKEALDKLFNNKGLALSKELYQRAKKLLPDWDIRKIQKAVMHGQKKEQVDMVMMTYIAPSGPTTKATPDKIKNVFGLKDKILREYNPDLNNMLYGTAQDCAIQYTMFDRFHAFKKKSTIYFPFSMIGSDATRAKDFYTRHNLCD